MRKTLILLVLASLIATSCSANPLGGDDPTATPAPTPTGTAQPPTATVGQPDEATATPASAPTGTAALSATATPPGTATGTESPETSATPAGDDGQSDGQVAQELEEIEQNVAELRGLEIQSDIDEEVITREQLRQNLEDLIAEDYSREQADREALALWLLRLIENRDLDLYQLQLDLLGEQVVGYYDPENDDLFLISENPELSASDTVTMAHEINHSLQDQHFGLSELQESAPDADHETALAALIEGDATLLMSLYVREYFTPAEAMELMNESMPQPGDTQVIDNAPRYIREGLTFPYQAGLTFVQSIYQQGGFEALNSAFSDPPQSTEQILHPEKYLQPERDTPIEVEVPDLADELGSGWEETYSDALGEWDLGIMLEVNGLSNADEAVAGWGGAQAELYQSGDDALTVLQTQWDTPQDASEFNDALVSTFESMEQSGELWTGGDRFYGVETTDNGVTLVSGTDQAAAEDALAALN